MKYLKKIETIEDIEVAKKVLNLTKKIKNVDKVIGSYYLDLTIEINNDEENRLLEEEVEEKEIKLFWYCHQDTPVVYDSVGYELNDGRMIIGKVVISNEIKV